jgi:hypothetical protein
VRFRFATFLPSVVPGGVVYAEPGLGAVFLGGDSIFLSGRHSYSYSNSYPRRGWNGMEWNESLRKWFGFPLSKSGMESGTPVEREVEHRGQRNTLTRRKHHDHPGCTGACHDHPRLVLIRTSSAVFRSLTE